MTGKRRIAVLAGFAAAWALTSCGGSGGEASAPDTAGGFGTGSAEVASTIVSSDRDGATPFGEEDGNGDGVQFVTTSSTTTTTTTTLPPTTTSTTTSTTSTTTSSTTTSTTSTTSTVPLPTTIRCSFAADALFEPGEATLTDNAVAGLADVVTSVTDVRGVRVEGHTDHRGSEEENLALSQARADAAAAALIDAGIDSALITAAGLGEAEADQGDPTEAEMAADRRVDIVVEAEVPITASC